MAASEGALATCILIAMTVDGAGAAIPLTRQRLAACCGRRVASAADEVAVAAGSAGIPRIIRALTAAVVAGLTVSAGSLAGNAFATGEVASAACSVGIVVEAPGTTVVVAGLQ